MALETVTSLIDGNNGTIRYTDEAGALTLINKAALVDNGDGTFTFNNGSSTPVTLDVSAFETVTTLIENTNNTFTYTNEAGIPTVVDVSNLETLTAIALNPDNTNIDYTDEDGSVTQISLANLVSNLETVTSLVDNNDGTFSFINEDGSTTTLNANNLETLTAIALNPDNTNIDYTDENGNVTQLNLTNLITNLETLSTLSNNGDGTFTYTDENGNQTDIDFPNLETITTLVLNGDGSLTYTNENNTLTVIDLNATALPFNPIGTSLTSTNVQDAIDELNGNNSDDQTLATNNTPGNISIEDGNSITLNVNDADADVTNEINTAFAVVGTNLDITDSNGTLSVPLAAIGSDDQNITDFSYDDASNILTITLEDGNTQTVDLAELSETVIGSGTITATDDGNGNYTLSSTDPDESTTNEINTAFAVVGTNLDITDSNGTLSVPLAAIGSDDQIITTDNNPGNISIEDGNILTLNVDDADADAMNEIQTITSTDASITVTPSGNDYDLSLNIPTETVTSLSQNTTTGIISYTNEDSTQQAANVVSTNTNNNISVGTDGGAYYSSPVKAMGKINGNGTFNKAPYNATVRRISVGRYQVALTPAMPDANYIIQLTIRDSAGVGNDDYDLAYTSQTATGFIVEVGDNDNGGTDRTLRDFEFMFTVLNY